MIFSSLLAVSLSFSIAGARPASTLSNSLTLSQIPHPQNFSVAAEPQCFSPPSHDIRVSSQDCQSILFALWETGEAHVRVHFSGDQSPWRFTFPRKNCLVMLYSRHILDEDEISTSMIASRAARILQKCDANGYGGFIPIGTNDFYVSVSGFNAASEAFNPGQNLTALPFAPANASVTNNSLATVSDSQYIRCFTDPFSALTPIDSNSCAREFSFLRRQRQPYRKQLIRGDACPVHFRYPNTECEITLMNVDRHAQEPFSPMDVVENAMQILNYCDGKGRDWGGQTQMDAQGFWWQVKGVPTHLMGQGDGGRSVGNGSTETA